MFNSFKSILWGPFRGPLRGLLWGPSPSSEIKWGGRLLLFYFLWFLVWSGRSLLVSGTPSRPYFPAVDIRAELMPPFHSDYLLGTDVYGRSVVELLSVGLHYSLGIALLVSLLSAFLGVGMGYLSVTGRPMVKHFSDLLTNLIFIFPSILIAILVMSVIGQSFWGLVFVLVITGWPAYARIARAEVKRVFSLPYVESAHAIGMGHGRLFFIICLPAILPVLMVHFILGIGGVIISESTLGFLGLGGSDYSWGTLLSQAKTVLLEAPFLTFAISLSMAGLIIGLNLLGDGLRDLLDPHLNFESSRSSGSFWRRGRGSEKGSEKGSERGSERHREDEGWREQKSLGAKGRKE